MKKSLFYFCCLGLLILVASCDKKYQDNLVGPTTSQADGMIVMTDSLTGEDMTATIPNGRAFICRLVLPVYVTHYNSITWDFADNIHLASDTGIIAKHKYNLTVSSNKTICAKIDTGGGAPLISVCVQVYVEVGTVQTGSDVIKVIDSIPYGSDKFITTYGLLAIALECPVGSSDSIFAFGNFGGGTTWVFRQVRSQLVNGRYQFKDTATNGDTINMAWGKKNYVTGSMCYATSAPRPPLWYNWTWNGEFNRWKMLHGGMVPIGSVQQNGPGTIGDPSFGDSAVTQFALSPGRDSLYRFFYKPRVSGNRDSAYTEYTVTTTTRVYLKTHPYFTDWWYSSIKLSLIQNAPLVRDHYHGNPTNGSAADIHNSYFYMNGYLEWQVINIGGMIFIENKKTQEMYPLSQLS